MTAPTLGFVSDTFDFLATADNWWGRLGIFARVGEHLRYSLGATLIAASVALPLGVWLGHLRRFGTAAINVGNIGRAVPTFGLMALAQQLWGRDELPVVGPVVGLVALVALAIPPILINTYTGMAEVPDGVRDAARGMGYTGRGRALRVELPVALPLVISGLRIAVVQVLATAAFVAVFGFGGLGRLVVDGLAQQDDGELVAGALVLAVLVIAAEVFFAVAQRLLVPAGVRRRRGHRRGRRSPARRGAATQIAPDPIPMKVAHKERNPQ